MNRHFFPFNERQGTRQLALDGSQFPLDLPPVEISSVVLEKEFVVQSLKGSSDLKFQISNQCIKQAFV